MAGNLNLRVQTISSMDAPFTKNFEEIALMRTLRQLITAGFDMVELNLRPLFNHILHNLFAIVWILSIESILHNIVIAI